MIRNSSNNLDDRSGRCVASLLFLSLRKVNSPTFKQRHPITWKISYPSFFILQGSSFETRWNRSVLKHCSTENTVPETHWYLRIRRKPGFSYRHETTLSLLLSQQQILEGRVNKPEDGLFGVLLLPADSLSTGGLLPEYHLARLRSSDHPDCSKRPFRLDNHRSGSH